MGKKTVSIFQPKSNLQWGYFCDPNEGRKLVLGTFGKRLRFSKLATVVKTESNKYTWSTAIPKMSGDAVSEDAAMNCVNEVLRLTDYDLQESCLYFSVPDVE